MISSWRRRRAAHRACKDLQLGCEGGVDPEAITIPSHFQCPISLDLMKDPVMMSTGITYDRESIEKWKEAGNLTCPVTKQALGVIEPIPNHAIRKMIQDWCVENRSFGIERIPTPRIPVSPMDVVKILSNITSASKRGDRDRCIKLVLKIKALVRECEQNKRCFATHGAGKALSSVFEEFSNASPLDENPTLFENILVTLPYMYPLDLEARSHVGSSAPLHRLVSLLRFGDLTVRRNAALALKEVVYSDNKKQTEELAEIDGSLEALYKLIKEPICPTSTKAALVVVYRMTSTNPTNKKTIARFVEMGLVSLLVETLVDADRSMSEKALSVLDGICNTDLGTGAVHDHSLSIAVLVKKLLRVSELATEFSVSVLLKLANRNRYDHRDESALVEALQVGAFQKLLLLLQVGCGDKTKEKATELLKILNTHRGRLAECVDTKDFKHLKRPF